MDEILLDELWDMLQIFFIAALGIGAYLANLARPYASQKSPPENRSLLS